MFISTFFLGYFVKEANLEFCPRILAIPYVKERNGKYVGKNLSAERNEYAEGDDL